LDSRGSLAAVGSAEAARERLEAGRGTQFEALELQSRALAAKTQVLVAEHEVAQRVLQLLSLSGELLARLGIEVDTKLNQSSDEVGVRRASRLELTRER